jgi:hypothetical protein
MNDVSEILLALMNGKKLKFKTDPDNCFIQFNGERVVNQDGTPIEFSQIHANMYELLPERQTVFQWCFYNSESGFYVLNPTLMTEEQAKTEFESVGLPEDQYFKTATKFNVIIPTND